MKRSGATHCASGAVLAAGADCSCEPVLRRLSRRAAGVVAAVSGLALTTAAMAQATFGGQPASRFKSVPNAEAEGGGAGDTLLGVIPVNTLFFITAAVIAVLWFTLGGGRRARVGRREH